jgi:hypothetical protein
VEERWKQPLERDVGKPGSSIGKKLGLPRLNGQGYEKQNNEEETKHSLIKIVN